MTLFRYSAITAKGKKSSGIINADSIELAKERLRKQNILATKVAPLKNRTAHLSLPLSLLFNFTRSLSILLRAGLPLYDALLTLEEKYSQSKLHSLFLNLSEQVKEGRHLSEALADYPKIFNPIYLSMVRAGEESGTLDQTFQKLSHLIQKEQGVKKKIVSALMYPLFLTIFCLLILTMLFFFLIPSMQGLLEERDLHPMTQFILDVSVTLNTHTALIFSTLGAASLLLLLFFRSKKGKKCFHSALFLLPFVKRMSTENTLSRFCRIFSLLLRSGIPLTESLNLAKCVMKQPQFYDGITQAEKEVISGKKLSESLKMSKWVPIMLIRMMAIGEESGNLGEMMEHIATIYEEDVDRSLLRFTSLLQPFMLLVMGCIVAIILLAVLLPLTDVSSLIQ